MHQNRLLNKQLQSLQNYILVKKNYVMALHRRTAYSRKGFASKTESEKNEIEIKNYETISKIVVAEKSIKKAEEDFKNQLNEFINDLAEISENYELCLEVAKKKQYSNIELKHLLYQVNWKVINENIDEKIAFYKQMVEAVSKLPH